MLIFFVVLKTLLLAYSRALMVLQESLTEYLVRNDESNQEERSDGQKSNSECSIEMKEMVVDESINLAHQEV